MPNRFGYSALIAVAVVTAASATSGAAEIRVLSANALNIAERNLGADFTKDTGQQVSFVFGSPGQVEQRLKAGETFDVVIMPAEAAAAHDKDWRPGSRHPFARVGIGLAVREGTRLDLASVESTRKALIEARSITVSDSSTGGLSGPNALKVLANLGIADAVKPKLVLSASGQELIAKGEVETGLFNVSEIPRAKGVILAGPVPAAVQVYINYDAAIPAATSAVEPALALLKYFTAKSALPRWQGAGLELAGE
ncbi:MAG TPA: substrate-binding domain-containing protein [Xanthobacteraceae bacterium]